MKCNGFDSERNRWRVRNEGKGKERRSWRVKEEMEGKVNGEVVE